MGLKKIDLYLVVSIVSSTLIVLFALLSIDILAKILDDASYIGYRNYTFAKMLGYVLGLMPW